VEVTTSVHFDVMLSPAEIKALQKVIDGKCEVQKRAMLSVTVIMKLSDKLTVEA
jgi:hypothetical protein